MKKFNSSHQKLSTETIIRVTMYIRPIIYNTSSVIVNHNDTVSAALSFDKKTHKYHTDVNPDRIINGPLSEPGEMLEPPISEEWDAFLKDCKDMVEYSGFHIIKTERSKESKKSEYIIFFGLDDELFGRAVVDLRVSDHPFDATFPEELKEEVLEYLKMENILNESATKSDINFEIEKITVGIHKLDSWDKAIDRLYSLLKRLRVKIKHQMDSMNN